MRPGFHVDLINSEIQNIDTRYNVLNVPQRGYIILNGTVHMDLAICYKIVDPLKVHLEVKDVENTVAILTMKTVDEILVNVGDKTALQMLDTEEEPVQCITKCAPTELQGGNYWHEVPVEVSARLPTKKIKKLKSQLNDVPLNVLKEAPYRMLKEVPVHVLQNVPIDEIQKLRLNDLINLKSVPAVVLQKAPAAVLKGVAVISGRNDHNQLSDLENVPEEVLQGVTPDILKDTPVTVLQNIPIEVIRKLTHGNLIRLENVPAIVLQKAPAEVLRVFQLGDAIATSYQTFKMCLKRYYKG
jgi:hypothetical protein